MLTLCFNNLDRVILSPSHSIDQILDYDIKKEAQSRGPVHSHGAAHVLDAPKLNESTDQKIVEFIDKYMYVTCKLPDEQ